MSIRESLRHELDRVIKIFTLERHRFTREEVERAAALYSNNEFVNYMVLRGNARAIDTNPLEQGTDEFYDLKRLARSMGSKELLSRPPTQDEIQEAHGFVETLMKDRPYNKSALLAAFDLQRLRGSKDRDNKFRQ